MNFGGLKKIITPAHLKKINKAIHDINERRANVVFKGDAGSVIRWAMDKTYKMMKGVFKNGIGDMFTKSSSDKLTDTAWEDIIRDNLDNPRNEYELQKLLLSYGFRSEEECANLVDRYSRRECLDELKNIKTHIQYNTKQIILMNGSLDEVASEVKRLNEMKKEAGNIFESGVIALKDPVYFRQKMYLASSKDFKDIRVEKFKYNYSISAWFYVHSQAPNFKKSYNKYTEILNYNFEPVVEYNSKMNTLRVRSKKSLQRKDGDEQNEYKVVYIKKNFKLQKWHNIVVNHVGGTVDTFLDGELVASEGSMAPHKSFNGLTIGEDKGISGGICNVIYYPTHITKVKIKTNYEFLKNKNPPVV